MVYLAVGCSNPSKRFCSRNRPFHEGSNGHWVFTHLLTFEWTHFIKNNYTERGVPFNPCHLKQCKNGITFILARQICTLAENSKVSKKS